MTTCVSVSEMMIGEASGRLGGMCTGIGPSLSRRKAGFGELVFDQPERGPHDVRLLAAVGILLAPIGTAQAVVIGRALEKLGERASLLARHVERNRDSAGFGHSGPPVRIAVC